MKSSRLSRVIVLFFLSYLSLAERTAEAAYNDDTCVAGRTVIVHLFNWKWTDIAEECERYLGPNQYCGVQVSPPNEHRDIYEEVRKRPWWERYQPISYKLISRSGNESQFSEMVARCNNVGVRIYVDAVINHMCYATAGPGVGSGGSEYNSDNFEFPGVPYVEKDFNCCQCGMCTTSDCEIQNYNEPNQVRNCRLGTLLDLALASTYVRQKIADYMNHLIYLGVGGFRIDALKHMWPGDVEVVLDNLTDLNTTWFNPGTRPFFFNEVIDLGGEAISSSEYTHLGRVTEFKYSSEIGKAFRNFFPLRSLHTIGPQWGMLPDDKAFIFVDNHDNQRGHGAGGPEVLTFWEPRAYKMATAFTLAYNYGFTRMMSSYYWEGGRWNGDWIGPPTNADWSIMDVELNADGSCRNGWICEHRWRQINNMVHFRNVVKGQNTINQWDNGNNQISFSRGNKGFIAFNSEDRMILDMVLPTGLPPGTYCDVISGNLQDGSCSGKVVYVDAGSYARIVIDVTEEDPFIAIHAESKLNDDPIPPETTVPPTTAPPTTPTPPIGYRRTAVLVRKQTQSGQDAFLRGGIGHDVKPDCTPDASSSECSVSIIHGYLGSGTHYEKYNAWRTGNTKLNWYGAQPEQSTYYGVPAQGSPMVWTTNDAGQVGYQPVNIYGPHYWLMDVQMDCTQTIGGWFEVKTFLTNYTPNNGWEVDINQVQNCAGSAGGFKPYASGNHQARCGFVNVFEFDSGSCEINTFESMLL